MIFDEPGGPLEAYHKELAEIESLVFGGISETSYEHCLIMFSDNWQDPQA
jgi:hypothetical protein